MNRGDFDLAGAAAAAEKWSWKRNSKAVVLVESDLITVVPPNGLVWLPASIQIVRTTASGSLMCTVLGRAVHVLCSIDRAAEALASAIASALDSDGMFARARFAYPWN